MISFAWDADYTCVTDGYTQPLTDEIVSDFDRPIVSDASLAQLHATLSLFGFYIADADVLFIVQWTDNDVRADCCA